MSRTQFAQVLKLKRKAIPRIGAETMVDWHVEVICSAVEQCGVEIGNGGMMNFLVELDSQKPKPKAVESTQDEEEERDDRFDFTQMDGLNVSYPKP